MPSFTDVGNLRFGLAKQAELAKVCELALAEQRLSNLHVQASFAALLSLDEEVSKLTARFSP